MLDAAMRIDVYVGIPVGVPAQEEIAEFLEALAYTGGGVSSRYEDGLEVDPITGEVVEDVTLVATVILPKDDATAGKTAVIAYMAKEFAHNMDQERSLVVATPCMSGIIDTDGSF